MLLVCLRKIFKNKKLYNKHTNHKVPSPRPRPHVTQVAVLVEVSHLRADVHGLVDDAKTALTAARGVQQRDLMGHSRSVRLNHILILYYKNSQARTVTTRILILSLQRYS